MLDCRDLLLTSLNIPEKWARGSEPSRRQLLGCLDRSFCHTMLRALICSLQYQMLCGSLLSFPTPIVGSRDFVCQLLLSTFFRQFCKNLPAYFVSLEKRRAVAKHSSAARSPNPKDAHNLLVGE